VGDTTGVYILEHIMISVCKEVRGSIPITDRRPFERKGGAVPVIWHSPSSGSSNHRPIRSDPSGVGLGREGEGGRGCGGREGSSKWKRGKVGK